MKATLAALIVMAVAVVACAPSPSAPSAVREVAVTMSDELRFEPDAITVAAGETIRFVVHNAGAVDHEFLIGDEEAQAEYAAEMADGHDDRHVGGAGVALEPGQTGEVTYTFAEPGELLIGCHEPGHYDGGMVGRITVQP